MNEQIRVANNFSDAVVSRGDGSKGFVREKRNKTARNLGSGEIPDAIFRKLRVSILRQLHPTIYLYIYIYIAQPLLSSYYRTYRALAMSDIPRSSRNSGVGSWRGKGEGKSNATLALRVSAFLAFGSRLIERDCQPLAMIKCGYRG